MKNQKEIQETGIIIPDRKTIIYASKVVVPGRLFVRRMIDTAYSVRQLRHWIWLQVRFGVVACLPCQMEWEVDDGTSQSHIGDIIVQLCMHMHVYA